MSSDDHTDLEQSKKNSFLDKLNKRNKERQNHIDAQQEQRNKEQTESEGADTFSQNFSMHILKIEKCLESIEEHALQKKHTNTLESDFVQVYSLIQELQRYLTSSTMFLTEFKVKACQNILLELTKRCDEKKKRLIPKKKFGFSGKKLTNKPIINPNYKISPTTSPTEEKSDKQAVVNFNQKSSGFEWTVCNRENEHIFIKSDEINERDVTLSNIKNCLIELQGHPGSLQISDAIGCTVLSGPISRSIFAQNCCDCLLEVACQQLRLHSSKKCNLYMHVTCRAIIEDCSEIHIGDYTYQYPQLDDDFKLSGLDKSRNNNKDVADFNWLSPHEPSPNWNMLDDNCRVSNWKDVYKNFK